MAQLSSVNVTKLRWNKYSNAYQKRLVEGTFELEKFLVENGINPKVLTRAKSSVADETLASFVNHMHTLNEKKSLRVAKHAVLFIQICRPRLGKHLQNTWSALRSWEEVQPSRLRAPLPVALLVALICQARDIAWKAESWKLEHMWYSFAALLGLGFFSLLRPGELLALTVGDISLPNSLSLGSSHLVVRIKTPKNSRQMGLNQFSSVQHPHVVNWISWLVSTKERANDKLWPFSPQKFRQLFQLVCSKLKLPARVFSPASLRAGGATWLVDEGCEIQRVRFLGRWVNLRSLEHYVQVARAQQIALEIPTESATHIKSFVRHRWFMLDLPVFFCSQVPDEKLLHSKLIPKPSSSDVIRSIRTWSRLEETVQEDRHSSWLSQGRKVP